MPCGGKHVQAMCRSARLGSGQSFVAASRVARIGGFVNFLASSQITHTRVTHATDFRPIRRCYNYWANRRATQYKGDDVQQWKETFPDLKRYTDSELQTWRNVFDGFDSDSDGYISRADLQKFPVFTVEKAALIKQHDRDRNNLIDFGEFIDAMLHVDVVGLKQNYANFDHLDLQMEFQKFAVPDVGVKATSASTQAASATDEKERSAKESDRAEGSPPARQNVSQEDNVSKQRADEYFTIESVKEMMKQHDFTVVTETDAASLLRGMTKGGKKDTVYFKEFREWLATPL